MKASEFLPFLSAIPAGKVATYATLARYFQTSPRAVASMLASNRELDLYPCYKVVRADGSIGGYRWWVPEKIRRLVADGVDVGSDRIDLERFGWVPTD